MTTLINILGAPGAGKTVLGTQLFTQLKIRGLDTEYVSEFVKGWTYEGRKVNKYGQYFIFGTESENQQKLFNKVDYVIADSPVLLTAFYQYYYWHSNTLIEPCKEFYKFAEEDNVKTYNIFIDRKYPYKKKGRFQTEEQSDELKGMLLNWLQNNNFPFIYLKCLAKERIPKILEILELDKLMVV